MIKENEDQLDLYFDSENVPEVEYDFNLESELTQTALNSMEGWDD